MKNMKKTLLMILAMMLVCAISVAATVAYFVAETKSVTNTFTFGNVDISLKEDTPGDPPTTEGETYNYDKVKPGEFYIKAPTITNEGSEVAWVRMTVKYDADVASALGAPELTDLLKNEDGTSSISTSWTYAGYYTDNGDKVYVYDYSSQLASKQPQTLSSAVSPFLQLGKAQALLLPMRTPPSPSLPSTVMLSKRQVLTSLTTLRLLWKRSGLSSLI